MSTRSITATPDELSTLQRVRAELRAQAWCEGAEAMREALRAALWQSLSADQIAAIRALPVPPCPEVSR